MTENYHFQIMLHQIQQAQQENPAEARRRAHMRGTRGERRVARTSSLRTLINGMKGRPRQGSSAPRPDAGAPC